MFDSDISKFNLLYNLLDELSLIFPDFVYFVVDDFILLSV